MLFCRGFATKSVATEEESIMEHKVVTMKNGTKEVQSLIDVTMLSLNALMKSNPIAFYEFVQICKDRNHRPFGNTGKILEECELLHGGQVHDSIRDIVLSAVEGTGLEMHLTDPIAKD